MDPWLLQSNHSQLQRLSEPLKMLTVKLILVLLVTVHVSQGAPLGSSPEELETPAEDRVLTAPYDINPYFGFRKYGELRYEPLTLPFFPGPPVPIGPPNAPPAAEYPSMPYSQSPPNYQTSSY